MPHVLIAHTSIGARTLLKIMLERMRYPTDIVSSPAEALTAASQHSPDLAILDIAFGDVSGFDVADELRASHPHLPIMIYSDKVSQDDVAKADEMRHGHNFTYDLSQLLKLH